MSKIYQDFYNTHVDRGFDLDNHFGWQCWDGYACYCSWLGYPYANCTVSGYVKDIWEQSHSNGTLKYFDEVSVMQPGDIAVFKEVAGWTPYSHIAIFHGDAGDGYGWFFGQNQGSPYTNPRGGSAFNLCKLPYSATYPTAFRPKMFGNPEQPVSGEWDANGTCYVGCTVKSVSLPIQGVQGNCVICNDLGGLVPLAHISEADDSLDGNAKDNYLETTDARIYLDPCTVEAVNASKNMVMVHGYWVKAEPLLVRK